MSTPDPFGLGLFPHLLGRGAGGDEMDKKERKKKKTTLCFKKRKPFLGSF
jgi:hypothetical protein